MRRITAQKVSALRIAAFSAAATASSLSTALRLSSTINTNATPLTSSLHRTAAATCTSAGPMRHTPVRLQNNNNTSEFDDGLAFDPTASLQKEAVYVSRGTQVEDVVRAWLPSNADEALRAKLRAHLHAFPINDMIRNESITITHVENENGEEVNKVPGVLQHPETGKNIEYSLTTALELVKERFEGKYLVQLAERDGKSYCRIRDEKSRFIRTVADEIDALERALGTANNSSNSGGGANKKPLRKMRDTVVHSFSDVVDAYFISWRHKKVVADLEKCHPVKLVIQKFQNPDNALTKMREMMDAVREACEAKKCIHHCSGIALSQNELSVTLMPVLDIENSKVKTIRHPSDQDWANAEKRMFEATGGKGTYVKSNVMKKQALGAREFRTDRFGRRIE